MDVLQDIIQTFDYEILVSIAQKWHGSVWDTVWKTITTLGNFGILWLVIAALLIVRRSTRRCGISILVALLLGLLVGNLAIKNLIQRPRPFVTHTDIKPLIDPGDPYSFPSAHALSSFAAATAILRQYPWFGVLCYIPALAIAFSRLYCCVHYPTDVLAGILLGVLCGIISAWITEHLINTFHYARLHLTKRRGSR